MWQAGLAISAGVGCIIWLKRRNDPSDDGASFAYLLIFGGLGLVIAGLR
jgi:hypothetical protein